jgi:hypothetical protein
MSLYFLVCQAAKLGLWMFGRWHRFCEAAADSELEANRRHLAELDEMDRKDSRVLYLRPAKPDARP